MSANLHPQFFVSYSNPSVGKLKVPRKIRKRLFASLQMNANTTQRNKLFSSSLGMFIFRQSKACTSIYIYFIQVPHSLVICETHYHLLLLLLKFRLPSPLPSHSRTNALGPLSAPSSCRGHIWPMPPTTGSSLSRPSKRREGKHSIQS